MNTKVETASGKLDFFKLFISLAILIAAIAAFYIYEDQSQLLRVVGLLAAAGVSIAIALQTDQGRTLWAFIQDAQIEVRKVVWPTRQETVNTTLIVIVVVIFFSLILFGLDWLLGLGIEQILGQGE